MCGIAGWLLDDPRAAGWLIFSACWKRISHRGPDDTGTYIDEESGVALGHNRLSIIDLSRRRPSADGEPRQWRCTDLQW